MFGLCEMCCVWMCVDVCVSYALYRCFVQVQGLSGVCIMSG